MTTDHIVTQHCCPDCQAKDETIRMLRWNPTLNMLRAAGFDEAIRRLPDTTTYTVVICDIDRLHAINSATGSYDQTDRYLAAGFAVRHGEFAGQLHDKCDEIGFVINEQARDTETDPDAFVARIARQLAGQPLTISERYALAAAQRCHVSEARLSATFATQSGLTAAQVPGVIEVLSKEVLDMKNARNAG